MRTLSASASVILCILFALPAVRAGEQTALDPEIHNAHWIWLKGFEETPNASICFRKTFNLMGRPKSAVLLITCDNEYKVWINGSPAGATVNKGDYAWRAPDSFDVAGLLKDGDNLVAIQGINYSGKGAVIAALAIDPGGGKVVRVQTDGSWQAALKPGEGWPLRQAQDENAAADGDWQPCLDYGRAETTAPWFIPRPPSELAVLIRRIKTPLASRMVSPVLVKLDRDTTAPVTGLVSTGGKAGEMEIRPAAPGQKTVVTCDFGREMVGYPNIIGYSYGPVKIGVACGEYEAECLDPFQPVSQADLSMGGIRWSTADRRAFRYLRLTIEPTQLTRIDRVQAEVVGHPVEDAGSFRCSDDTLNKVYDTSAYTVRLCMQDFYEDGIKRDRLLWIGDLRVEALVNYYTFGDIGLAKRSLVQMADLQLPDGMIPGVGPDFSSTYLPDYCAYWVMALADYYRYTGDLNTVKLLYPNLQKLMRWFKANSDQSGMFVKADRPGWWIFVDWDESLEKKDRVMAMEALYHWALMDAAEIAKAVAKNMDAGDYLARAEKLKQSVNAALWSKEKRGYVDCLTDSGPSQKIHRQPNALALLSGVAGKERIPDLIGVLTRASRTTPVTTPYMNFYVASALFAAGRSKMALDLVRSYWGAMIARGATTCWEKFDPEWPAPHEQKDLSYCHGWSAGPGQVLPAYVAGVRPAKPGFDQALISPDLGGLAWVKAVVPTPKGPIRVDWRDDRGRAVGSVTLPADCSASFALPSPPAGAAYAVDGKPVEATEENRMTCFALKGGRTYALSLVSAGSKQ
jgi:hypothetical protein